MSVLAASSSVTFRSSTVLEVVSSSFRDCSSSLELSNSSLADCSSSFMAMASSLEAFNSSFPARIFSMVRCRSSRVALSSCSICRSSQSSPPVRARGNAATDLASFSNETRYTLRRSVPGANVAVIRISSAWPSSLSCRTRNTTTATFSPGFFALLRAERKATRKDGLTTPNRSWVGSPLGKSR